MTRCSDKGQSGGGERRADPSAQGGLALAKSASVTACSATRSSHTIDDSAEVATPVQHTESQIQSRPSHIRDLSIHFCSTTGRTRPTTSSQQAGLSRSRPWNGVVGCSACDGTEIAAVPSQPTPPALVRPSSRPAPVSLSLSAPSAPSADQPPPLTDPGSRNGTLRKQTKPNSDIQFHFILGWQALSPW